MFFSSWILIWHPFGPGGQPYLARMLQHVCVHVQHMQDLSKLLPKAAARSQSQYGPGNMICRQTYLEVTSTLRVKDFRTVWDVAKAGLHSVHAACNMLHPFSWHRSSLGRLSMASGGSVHKVQIWPTHFPPPCMAWSAAR